MGGGETEVSIAGAAASVKAGDAGLVLSAAEHGSVAKREVAAVPGMAAWFASMQHSCVCECDGAVGVWWRGQLAGCAAAALQSTKARAVGKTAVIITNSAIAIAREIHCIEVKVPVI